jgi:hypothetical protein
MSEWQLIETAPKDGTHVDLWAKRWRPRSDDFEFCRFPARYWEGRVGWVKSSNGGISYDPKSIPDASWRITHWMPLPKAPT